MRTIAVWVATVLPVLGLLPAPADARVPGEIRQRLTVITENPQNTYQLDIVAGKALLERVDGFFSQHVNFKSEARRSGPGRKRLEFRVPGYHARPVLLAKDTVKPTKEFHRLRGHSDSGFVWYGKEPTRRSYSWEYDEPARGKLDDAVVIELGRDFLADNDFIHMSSIDEMEEPVLVTRKKRPIKSDGELGAERLIFHRAIFKRQVNGIPVFNSKQIIDIHPDLKQLIAYKHRNWLPLQEQTGTVRQYKPLDRLIQDIRKMVGPGFDWDDVGMVTPGYMQTDKELLPVVKVQVTHRGGDASRIEEIFFVPLVPTEQTVPDTDEGRRPIEAPDRD